MIAERYGLCAHCVNEGMVRRVLFDGRPVLMCVGCIEGPVRGGNYSFGGGPEKSGAIAPGWLGDGNRRRGEWKKR